MSNSVVRCGLDIAKYIFVLHGVDAQGKTIVRKPLHRTKVLSFFAQLPACTIGIEACGGAHYWARELGKQGHVIRLINAGYVTPYRRKNKNDANDAEAICEAIDRPNMRFVAVKSEDQQSILMAHRIRQQSIATRTSLINQLHGHLHEFGIVIRKGKAFAQDVHAALDQDHLPNILIDLVHDLLVAIERENDRVAALDKRIGGWVKADPLASKLMKLDGIGALTASAVIATAGDAKAFKNGRHFSSWLGLVPKQHSSGGKNKLSGITKRGDRYLRMLLIHGARTVLLMSSRGRGKHHEWISSLRSRRPDNVVAVAFAAKQARMLWAIMAGKDEPSMAA